MHHNIFNALNGKFCSDGFRHLFGIAVHGTVDNDNTLFGRIPAQAIVDADNLGNIIRPYRSVSGADGGDGQTAQLCQCLLHGRAVLAHDIGVITNHFIPILIQIHACIKESAIERTEAPEAVTGEQHAFRFVEGHHGFGPVHHRSHIETELVVAQGKKVFIFYHILLARHAIETFYHTESLLVSNNDDVGIMLFD